LSLPETVTVGLAAPFSRPARSAVTLAALTFGLTGVVLGTGLNTSIDKINHSAIHGLGQLQTTFTGLSSAFTSSQDAAVRAALRAQPGTLHYVGETDLQHFPIPAGPGAPPSKVNVAVAARPNLPLMTYAYDGVSSWLGWSLVSGRWYDGPGQVDVSTVFAAETRRSTGDSVRLTVNGEPVTMRIAGEVFIPQPVPAVWASRRPSAARPPGWPSISTTWASRRAPASRATPTRCSGHCDGRWDPASSSAPRARGRSPGSWTRPCSRG
jgi:putative ABC transport system permease protein